MVRSLRSRLVYALTRYARESRPRAAAYARGLSCAQRSLLSLTRCARESLARELGHAQPHVEVASWGLAYGGKVFAEVGGGVGGGYGVYDCAAHENELGLGCYDFVYVV